MGRVDTIMDRGTARVLDEYLVLAAGQGDRQAFEHLARRWDRRLVAHAWRLTGDREAARDMAQAAWVQIARGLASLKDEAAFPAWAYRIVSRQCARFVAAQVWSRALDQAVAAEPEATPTMPEGPDRMGERRLHAAIARLPAGQRAAIALFHFEELSVAEVAVALDVPAGTVKTRLMHARRTLRAALEGDHDAQTRE